MAILQLVILIEIVFSIHVFHLIFVFVNLDNFLLLFDILRFFFIYFLQVGNFFRRSNLIKLSMFPQLIHNFQHVVFQAQSSISFTIKVNFNNNTIFVEIYPANVTILKVYLVVQVTVNNSFVESVASSIDQTELVFVVGK